MDVLNFPCFSGEIPKISHSHAQWHLAEDSVVTEYHYLHSPQAERSKKASTPDFPVLVDICVLLLDVCWQLVHFFTPFSWSNMSGEFQWIADDLIILDLKVKMWFDDRCPFRWSIIRSTLLLYSYHGISWTYHLRGVEHMSKSQKDLWSTEAKDRQNTRAIYWP